MRSWFICAILFLLHVSVNASDLFERIQQDIDKGKDIVITSYVGLWYVDNKRPEVNLYWGALYGHKALFDRPKELKARLPFLKTHNYDVLLEESSSRDPLRIRVIANKLNGDQEKIEKRRSRVVLVYLVYQDNEKAMYDMGLQLKTGALPDGIKYNKRVSTLLQDSYLIGYWGHNVYYGGYEDDDLEEIENTVSNMPRGVFVFSCQSARWCTDKLVTGGIESISFTTTNMAPEAYIGVALYDGIRRGLSKREINKNIARAYQVYQRLRKPPFGLFIDSVLENSETIKPKPSTNTDE